MGHEIYNLYHHDDVIPLGNKGEWKPFEVIGMVSALTDEERNSNVLANCMKGFPILSEMKDAHDRKAILVCYGPSLQDTWPTVALSKFNGADIITVSGAHKFLIERNVIPTHHIDCDPRERKARQFGLPHKDVKYWIGSCVDPLYIEILEGFDVTLWHNHNGPASEEFVWDIDPTAPLLVGGSSVGLRAINLLYSQGYRDFEIHGMDCSFRDEHERHAGDHLSPKPKYIKVKFNEREFLTSPSFAEYAKQFDDQKLLPNATFRLHGDGLLQHMQRSSA